MGIITLRGLVDLKLPKLPVRIRKRLRVIRHKISTVSLGPATDALVRAHAGGRAYICVSVPVSNLHLISINTGGTHNQTPPKPSQA